ncbi:MAG: methyltransferase domain-containing protein [Candidatus Bathyarchaeota archaeon]
MKEFTEDWYDHEYFADSKGKKFTRPDGSVEYWGYRNPEGIINGANLIIDAWKKLFKPKNMLDVGCGRGAMVAYARDAGIEAFGFDWSKFAVGEGRFNKCKKDWIVAHDATKLWPYPDNSFDLTISLDLWEHIYLDFPYLPRDVRSLIYLKCYSCSQRRNGLCPLTLAVSANIGENIKEKVGKTPHIERNNTHTHGLGEKSKKDLIRKAGKKDKMKPLNVHMKSLKETLKDGKNEKDNTLKERVNGEKIIKKRLNNKLASYIESVKNTSVNTQRNIKNFWQNINQFVSDILEDTIQKEKINSLNSKDINAKIVETRINELLKSIISMEEKNEDNIGYMTKIGDNCNSCVPTVIRLCTSDLEFAVSEMFRVARKWCFLEIATVDGVKEKGYILKKGEPIPLVEDGRTWAGHVTVQPADFWLDQFDHEDWMLRRDMTNYFYGLLSPGYVRNWLLNTVLVLEKI